MAAFYSHIDLLVVPSLNGTESFGLVQIEAMMCGTPVVASNLPGVRQPVAMTGMGAIARVGDADDLAAKMTEVLDSPRGFTGDPAELSRRFAPDVCAASYETLYSETMPHGDP